MFIVVNVTEIYLMVDAKNKALKAKIVFKYRNLSVQLQSNWIWICVKNNLSASTNSQGPVESKVVAKLYFSYLKERKREGRRERGMGQGVGRKKERRRRGWNWISSEVDETRVCHTDWSKSEREKNIYHILTDIYWI